MSIYEIIHRWGRTCLQCGSFRSQPSLFCKSCERALIISARHKKIWWSYRGDLISGVALFTWIPDRNRPLSLLIESLKGPKLKKAWEFWAQQVFISFPTEFSTELKSDLKPIFIPAPSSAPDLQDHAFVFAQSLAALTGCQLKSCLRKDSKESQKGLQRAERSLIQLSSDEIFSDEQPLVFIDDVVTTGATAKAAYLALGKPKKFFVLALASRE